MTDNLKSKGWSLEERNPKTIAALMPIWDWFYRYYFQVKTDGWHHISNGGRVLLVGSHNGGLAAPDLFMTIYDWFRRFGTERLAYGLMHPYMWKVYPAVARLAMQMGAIAAHPKMAIAALQGGASVLVYPGGGEDLFRPHSQRDRIHFAGRQGFIKLALREQVPIIPVISTGAHDTLFVVTDLYPIVRQLHEWGMPWLFGLDPQVFPLFLGLPWGIALGPVPNFPLPAQIRIRICAPIVFDRYGPEAARDRAYVAACYHHVETTMQTELDRLMDAL